MEKEVKNILKVVKPIFVVIPMVITTSLGVKFELKLPAGFIIDSISKEQICGQYPNNAEGEEKRVFIFLKDPAPTVKAGVSLKMTRARDLYEII